MARDRGSELLVWTHRKRSGRQLLCSLADSLSTQYVFTECKILGFPARVGLTDLGRNHLSLRSVWAQPASFREIPCALRCRHGCNLELHLSKLRWGGRPRTVAVFRRTLLSVRKRSSTAWTLAVVSLHQSCEGRRLWYGHDRLERKWSAMGVVAIGYSSNRMPEDLDR